jgi:hypothetical protein
MQQQQLEQQQQQFQQKLEIEEQRRREEAAREDMNKELDRQNRLEVEKLRGIANEGSFSQTADTTDLLIKQTQISQQMSKQNFDKSMKSKEMSLKEKELQLREKDIDTKLKIAKENRNKYSK